MSTSAGRTSDEDVVIDVSAVARRESFFSSSASQHGSQEEEDSDATETKVTTSSSSEQDRQDEEDSDATETKVTTTSSSEQDRQDEGSDDSEHQSSGEPSKRISLAEPSRPAICDWIFDARDDEMIELVKWANETVKRGDILPEDVEECIERFPSLIIEKERIFYKTSWCMSENATFRVRWRLSRLMWSRCGQTDCCNRPDSPRGTAAPRTRAFVAHVADDTWQLLIRLRIEPKEFLKLRLVCKQTCFAVDECIREILVGEMEGRGDVATVRVFDAQTYPLVRLSLLSQLINGGPWVDAPEDGSNTEGRGRLIQKIVRKLATPPLNDATFRSLHDLQLFCLEQCRDRSFLVNVLLKDDGIKNVYDGQVTECRADVGKSCSLVRGWLVGSITILASIAYILVFVSLFCMAGKVPFGTCYGYGSIIMTPVPLLFLITIPYFVYKYTLCCGGCA